MTDFEHKKLKNLLSHESKENFKVMSYFYFILYYLQTHLCGVNNSELGGKKILYCMNIYSLIFFIIFILKLLSSQFCIGTEALETHSLEFILQQTLT